MKIEFDAKLAPAGRGGTSCFLHVPPDVMKTFGTRARVPVTGTINGYAFRSTLMPWDKGHILCVNREMRAGSGTRAGDTAHFVMERDSRPRNVQLPAGLKKALADRPQMRAAFDALSYTHRKEYAQWIGSAKKPETLARRLEKMEEMLRVKSHRA